MTRASSTKKAKAYQPPNLQSLTPIERIDFPFGRAYAPQLDYLKGHFKTQEWTKENRQHLPSVTTIQQIKSKGIGFDKWLSSYSSYEDAMAYANKAAQEGTQIHICGEQLAMGVDMDFDQPYFDVETQEVRPWTNPMIKFMESFQQFYLDHTLMIEGSEVPLFDSRQNFTGTLDMVGKIKLDDSISDHQKENRKKCSELKEGESGRMLIDVKTLRNSSTLASKFANHKYQVTAYKMLWNGLFPEHPIEYMGVLYIMNSWRGAPKYKLKIVKENLEEEWKMWTHLWHKENGVIKPVYRKPRSRTIKSCFKVNKNMMVTDPKLKGMAISKPKQTNKGVK